MVFKIEDLGWGFGIPLQKIWDFGYPTALLTPAVHIFGEEEGRVVTETETLHNRHHSLAPCF